MIAAFHFRHGWFFAIFLSCGVIVFANIVHYVLFRVLRRKEAENRALGWGVQRYLSHPARAIFFITSLLLLLPTIPALPPTPARALRHGFIMPIVAATAPTPRASSSAAC